MVDETAATSGQDRVADRAAGSGHFPVKGIRALLRLRLFYKLIIANIVILVAAILGCAAVAASAIRADPASTVSGAVLPVALAALVVSALVNAVLVRLALAPLHSLEATARRVERGDYGARAPASALADAELEQLTGTFNAMLDSIAGYRDRSRELAFRAYEAAEAERKRIAAELHDGVAQTLSAVLLLLRLARRTQEEDRRAELLDRASTQLAGTTEELRAIARGLRPPTLDMLGLASALEGHARLLAETSDVRIEVRGDRLDRLLSSETELALYRLAQEALANVVRHAGARNATVDINARNGTVVTTIRDDGRGFRVADALAAGGLGLFGMRERAAHVGGRVDITSEPGRGTEVRIELPADGTKTNG